MAANREGNGKHVGFSVLIPARNEEGALEATVAGIAERFSRGGVSDYEVIVIDDCSSDSTAAIAKRLAGELEAVRYIRTAPPGGFGAAVRKGFDHYCGDGAAIVMADASETAADVFLYYEKLRDGALCVFGSRFICGGSVNGYPHLKFVLNRIGNRFLSLLFGIAHDDITNGFKAYRREVIDDVQPLTSRGFELSLELPLKSVLKGHPFVTAPVSWKARTAGRSKFGLPGTCVGYLLTALRLRLLRIRNRKSRGWRVRTSL